LIRFGKNQYLASPKTFNLLRLWMQPNYRRFIPPSITGMLSLTLGDRKDKRTELDGRRLTLCHAKVGEDKSISVPWRKCWRDAYPRVLRPS